MRSILADSSNEFGWSVSRSRDFEGCLRRYYYGRYLKRGGWDKRALEDCQTANRLSQMTTAPMLSGQIIHETILTVLKNYRDSGILLSVDGAVKRAIRQWEVKLFPI